MYSGLNKLFTRALETGEAFAAWRMPGEKEVHFILSGTAKPAQPNDIRHKGFLFAPFDNRLHTAWFFEGEARQGFFEDDTHTGVTSEMTMPAISTTKAHYTTMVKKAVASMKAGVFKKIVVARRESRPVRGNDPLAFFRKTGDTYPSAFCYLLSSPETGTWTGASPELLMDFDRNGLKTVALAGTKTRETSSWGDKEREEQQFVVDYISDTLKGHGLEVNIGPRKETGSGHLLHLVNEIEGKGGDFPATVSAVLESLHPTPAIAGIPKTGAMDFIRLHEDFDRAYYSGYLGYTSGDTGRFYVNLRCMEWKKDHCVLYAGAGLTKHSDPEKEWEETNGKLKVLGDLL